ncbi:uncharacterized protein LOC132260037 [Phlebotomus argentipes]|uniref:uncharacterized protein LOC132260037 n=1 Tax=Phlebotomus argentipes TaxID=94469 RepID=UPI00289378AC|nr:uncharacterized protein LOC132260037 [Phlebotomus argentipes]
MENTQNPFINSTGDISCIDDTDSILPLVESHDRAGGFCDDQQRLSCTHIFPRDGQSSDLLPNIFVQIPMQRMGGYQSQIKAEESIKSEVMELGLRKAQSPFLLGNEELVTARVKPTKIHKCKHCPFITISPTNLTSHAENHLEETPQISCPGCVNTFRTKKSLEVHLLRDHQILESELEAMVEFTGVATKSPPNSNRSTPKTRPNCSRIFIKSVDVLRNPVEENFMQENHNRINFLNDIMQQPEQPGTVSTPGNAGIFGSDCTPSPDIDRGDLIVITPTSMSESVHSNTADQIEIVQEHSGKMFMRGAENNGQNSAFLHLRTVDELNLMNLEDVQNINRQNNMSNDNSKHSSDEVVILDDAHIPGNLFSMASVADSGENRDNALSSTLQGLQEIMASYAMNEKDPGKIDDSNSFKNFLSMNGDNVHVEQQSDFGNFQALENIIDGTNYFSQQPCFCVSEDAFSGAIPEQEMPRDVLLPIADNSAEINTPTHSVQIPSPVEASAEDTKALGRIYVVKNLLEESSAKEKKPKKAAKNIGRPKGARKTGITELKKLYSNITSDEIGTKCDQEDCAIRFRSPSNLSYHRQCHSNENCGIICPECKNTDFRNWNTLHTHLWREHQIDMELYSCEICNFKTPVLSRLKNTHVKIHSEERNFKCELCEKAFKNTKQLKNHRRIHRSAAEHLPVKKCDFCPATVVAGKQYKKHLRAEHGCPGGHTCGVCGKNMNSMAALKIHEKKHADGGKFSCPDCDYTTHDHNAARRHRMKHGKEKQYKCPFCGYKSIQSTTYRNHLVRIHPAQADEVIFKCTKCSFETINRTKHRLHVAKHETAQEIEEEDILEILSDATEPSATPPLAKHNKIKVKSNLVLRDPSKFINTNNLLLQNLQPHQMLPTPPAEHLPLIRPALFSKTFPEGDGMKQVQLTDRLDTPAQCNSPQYPNIDLT